MKRKNTTWIIELKDIKTRRPWAPVTRKFKDKTKYNRRDFKLVHS